MAFQASQSLADLEHQSHVIHLATLLAHPTSFLVVFPCCVFLQSFQLSQSVPVSLFSSQGYLVFIYSIYERSYSVSFL